MNDMYYIWNPWDIDSDENYKDDNIEDEELYQDIDEYWDWD